MSFTSTKTSFENKANSNVFSGSDIKNHKAKVIASPSYNCLDPNINWYFPTRVCSFIIPTVLSRTYPS